MHDGRILIELVSGVPVVAAPEEIDMANAPELASALLEAAADRPGILVAAMTQTRFCDAAGVRTLLTAHKRAQADGGELLLVVPNAAVLRVLAITGLDRLIPNFTSLDDALAHTSPNGSDGPRAVPDPVTTNCDTLVTHRSARGNDADEAATRAATRMHQARSR